MAVAFWATSLTITPSALIYLELIWWEVAIAFSIRSKRFTPSPPFFIFPFFASSTSSSSSSSSSVSSVPSSPTSSVSSSAFDLDFAFLIGSFSVCPPLASQPSPFSISVGATSSPRASYALLISSSVTFVFLPFILAIFNINEWIFSAFSILIPGMSLKSLSITSAFEKVWFLIFLSTDSFLRALPVSVSNAFSSSSSKSSSISPLMIFAKVFGFLGWWVIATPVMIALTIFL